jgi:hypothetical protein
LENILKNIIQNEPIINEYPLFKDFCRLKEKGLRKEAFKSLISFIEEVKGWEIKRQLKFVVWLFGWFEVSDDIHLVLVHPLKEQLMKPMLEEWFILDPKDPRPYRWYGLYLNSEDTIKYLKLAIEIGGNKEQQALVKLIGIYFHSLWYSFHHISEDLYLGEVNEDTLIIEIIENLIIEVNSEQYKKEFIEDLLYYKNILSDWVEFKQKTSKGFVNWCKLNGKEYNWVNSYYYD